MKIVVGLGNPGKQYDGTRHNVGWMVLDRIAERAGWTGRGKTRDDALAVRGRWGDTDLVLVKPLTYMNLSGESVRELLRLYGLKPNALLVVYDDVDLPTGTIRIRERGGPGTHNGMRSIVDEIDSTDFPRLRIGVGSPTNGQNLADYVLGVPSAEERVAIDVALDRAVEAIQLVARRGLPAAMNQFNT